MTAVRSWELTNSAAGAAEIPIKVSSLSYRPPGLGVSLLFSFAIAFNSATSYSN